MRAMSWYCLPQAVVVPQLRLCVILRGCPLMMNFAILPFALLVVQDQVKSRFYTKLS